MNTSEANGHRKSGPRRTPVQREHDRAQIVRLSVAGETQRAIAEELGLSQSQVCDDLGVARRQWSAERVRDLDGVTREELARLDDVEAKAIRGFEESKSAVAGGDPRFLDIRVKVQARRAKLLGLDAAAQVNIRSVSLRGEWDLAAATSNWQERLRLVQEQFDRDAASMEAASCDG